MTSPTITWDIGTAYDFFVSLSTLHRPADFGLRGSWAVGVRTRLPQEERDFLNEVTDLIGWPVDWVSSLTQPKNADMVLEALEDIPAAQRIAVLSHVDADHKVDQVLLSVAEKGSYDTADEEAISTYFIEHHGKKKTKKKKDFIQAALKWWSQPAEFGERYLHALKLYHEVFFAEDEKRLQPALEQSLANAQELSKKLSVTELLQELSQGVEFEEPPHVKELVLAPSFWASPLILLGPQTPAKQIILFGGRPADASVVPGEVIPDALHQSLKALADPTRLRILRYLMKEPLTPTELANRLRLRAPTVVHHLQAMRLARLVYVTYGMEGKRYRARHAAVRETYALLDSFLGASNDLLD